LSSNNNSIVEIVVQNSVDFISRNKNALSWLKQYFMNRKRMSNNSICIRNYASNHMARTRTTNTWRFLEVPKVHATYTYIADIDIFLTESILINNSRIKQMEYFSAPYSNIIRPNTKRLTGLMLVDTKHYYTSALINAQRTVNPGMHGNDEIFLHNLVVKAGYPLPKANLNKVSGNSNDAIFYSTYRPQHGVHLSSNRGPGKGLCQTSVQTIRDEMFAVVPNIGEYLCHDSIAVLFLSKIIADSYKQEQHNMKTQYVGAVRICKA